MGGFILGERGGGWVLGFGVGGEVPGDICFSVFPVKEQHNTHVAGRVGMDIGGFHVVYTLAPTGDTSKPPSHPLHLTADTIGGDDPGPPPAGIYRGSNRLGRSRVTYLQPTGREIARSIPSSDPPS